MAGSFSNDGSFMEQFLRNKFAAKKKTEKELQEEKETQKREEKAKQLEEKRKAEEKKQKEREELEEEQKKREELIQKIMEDKQKQEDSSTNAPAIPKARRQPFQSTTKPQSQLKKRSQPPPRSKPAMPVAKRQKTSLILPRNRTRVIPPIEPPKPPPLNRKAIIDELADKVVTNGIEHEQKIKRENKSNPNFRLVKNNELKM